jgi:hypothetical protein
MSPSSCFLIAHPVNRGCQRNALFCQVTQQVHQKNAQAEHIDLLVVAVVLQLLQPHLIARNMLLSECQRFSGQAPGPI